MGTNPYKALLVDLDGTLALPYMRVSPRVADAVARAAKVLTVGIVSSRDHQDVGRLAAQLGLPGLHISEGGSRIFDPQNGRSKWSLNLASANAQAVVAFLDENRLAFSGVDAGRRVESSPEILSWQLTRITATSLTEPQARDIAADFGARDGVHTAVIKRIDNGDWMVDFTHAEATKATAVERYAALHRFAPSQVIGAGDSYNDLPLLGACGLGIAMGNAAPELKAIADYVAPTVEDDGLAVAIDEFVLPRLAGGSG